MDSESSNRHFADWVAQQPVGLVNLLHDLYQTSEAGRYKVELRLLPRTPVTKDDVAKFEQIISEVDTIPALLKRLR